MDSHEKYKKAIVITLWRIFRGDITFLQLCPCSRLSNKFDALTISSHVSIFVRFDLIAGICVGIFMLTTTTDRYLLLYKKYKFSINIKISLSFCPFIFHSFVSYRLSSRNNEGIIFRFYRCIASYCRHMVSIIVVVIPHELQTIYR